jgi:hypothetical protein
VTSIEPADAVPSVASEILPPPHPSFHPSYPLPCDTPGRHAGVHASLYSCGQLRSMWKRWLDGFLTYWPAGRAEEVAHATDPQFLAVANDGS